MYSCAQQGRLEGPIPRSTTPRAPRYLSDPNPPPRVSRPRPKCEMVIGRKRDALVSMPSFSRHQLVTFSPEKQFPPPSCNLAALHVPPPPPTSLAATSSPSPTSHTHRITPPAPTHTLSPESRPLYQPHPIIISPDTTPIFPTFLLLSSNQNYHSKCLSELPPPELSSRLCSRPPRRGRSPSSPRPASPLLPGLRSSGPSST